MLARSSLALVLAGGLAAAQVPYGHFLVTARNAAAVGTGAYLLDGRSGDLTPVLGLTSTTPPLTAIFCAALEPASGDLMINGGVALSLAPIFYRLTMTGRTAGQLRRVAVTGFAGGVTDLTFDPNGQILFVGGGTNTAAGLWRVAPGGGAATQLGPVPDGVEVVSTSTAAFVLTRRATMPSSIWRYDYGTSAWGQVVAGLPESTAFDAYAGPLMMVGTQQTQLYLADTVSGQATLFNTLTGGAITALRVSPQNGRTVILTTSGNVLDLGGNLLATINSNMSDVDVGPVDQAVFFTFGSGCAGSNAQTPAIGASGQPTIPGPAFAITLAGALPSTAVVHALGYSRRDWSGIPLPFDLGGAGAPGCTLLCNGLLLNAGTANANGQASMPLPIPADLSLLSATVMNQWWVLDPTANALGFVFSDGGEAVLR